MRRRAVRWTALVLCALAASGCASLAPLEPIAGESFSGRLALKVEAAGSESTHAFSSTFDLRGDSHRGALGLSTPLGSMLAQARWSPGDVLLTTPQGSRRFADLDALTREALGESVPVEAWFDWLHGRPWPDAPSTTQDGRAGFAQLGWSIDLTRLADGAVVATRTAPPPIVTVRIQLDRS